MIFNHESRTKNVLRSSFTGLVSYALLMFLGFGYRLFFLRILSIEYLGIDGLFTNILSILGLTELGIADSIIYRLYKPLSMENDDRVGQLMHFFKQAYWLIALAIFLLGCIVCPFLKTLILDGNEIPADVNIYVVFMLLLIQTCSTYLFSYKIALLNADQKQYQTTIINTICSLLRYFFQMTVLIFTRSYTITLTIGIYATLIVYLFAGEWVAKQYPRVFEIKTDLSQNEKKDIYKDTVAALLHKVGGTVVTSTDNILLAKFMGLAITGIYANYAMIVSGVTALIGVIIAPLSSALGNVHVTMDDGEKHQIYKKMFFLNLWGSGLLGCCLYNLINDFIVLWLKEEFFLSPLAVLLICLLFYMQSSRFVSISYTQSCGLFTKDRFRPVIESILNIVISILCMKMMGTAGIFVGTLASNLVTVFWREPYLLYKYVFHHKVMDYWKLYFMNFAIVAAATWIASRLKMLLFGNQITIIIWIGSGLLCAFVYSVIHGLIFFQFHEYRYFVKLLYRRIHCVR